MPTSKSVWIHMNGDIKKVAECKVKPFQLVDRESIKDVSKEGDAVSKKVMLEDGLQDVENLLDPEDLGGDTIGAKYLANTVSFLDMCSYVIELPVSEHKNLEVKVAKRNEIQNLKDYDTFEEVWDDGQDKKGSQWVVTQKEKHDRQKQPCKARLVARGFQESLKPQSDSPTEYKESFKMLMAIAAN